MIPERDFDLLGALVLDPDAEATFDMLKYCLMWPDERPSVELSQEGRELLTDLWIVRGFIHRSLPREKWGLDPQYFAEVWELGLAKVPEWPGFKRLVLSERDSAYLTSCLATSLSTL